MYLLLRNNKQSGPYSVDDLKSMGLKAYDLVWLEGKSAAWRYPCEMEELSAFAPPVEEQPFDRFYKKPVTTAKPAEEPVVTAKSIDAEPVSIVIPPAGPGPFRAEAPAPALPLYTGEPSAVPGKRIIYVTMPAGRNPALPAREARETQSSVAREIPAKEHVRESVRPATPDPSHAAYASGPGYAAANASRRVEDYSSQLPSLEEQLEAVSPRRKRKEYNARIVRPLVIGATVLAVLAAGIFIGLSLNRNATGVRQTIASKNPAENTSPSIAHPVSQQLPVSAASPALTAATNEKPADSLGIAPGSGADGSRTSVPPIAKPARGALKERPVTPRKSAAALPAVKDSAAGSNAHREAVHRADIVESMPETKPVDKEAVRAAVSSQVSVGANGYNVGTFGGISDLQLTVTNRSIYPLDLVVVEVQYIQANKKVYKTENLYFRNIGAGSALMQEAPKSSRGIKVQYKITTISPRA
ncbi:MAG TPA: hypothetical protein VHE34_13270 [Puia sp.]|uniref:hypothetical protein n=1 Tax=Puia sp. TaxID=2045100 RepID=UPI002D0A4E89|nr:hypothetical protein [Puia sp.]HVU96192.1 hypothetical protein [Puia sp.]